MRTRTYEYRKKAGVCVQCGGSLDGAKTVRCKKCRDQQQQYLDMNFVPRTTVKQAPDPSDKRCEGCGLRMPCNRCLPTARELAEQRFTVDSVAVFR